jgi:mannose-1-phosphate guanylyltransferase
VYPVVRFHEKPSAETAAEMPGARGNFRWNAGMFVWSVPALWQCAARDGARTV